MAGILPDAASQLFDVMPKRTSSRISEISVPLEPGEIWERGPEVLERDGSAIHATFSKSLASAGCSEQTVQASCNAGLPLRPGTSSPPLGALDAHADELRRGGKVPVHARRADGLLASSRAALSGRQPVLEQTQRSAFSQPGDLRGSE